MTVTGAIAGSVEPLSMDVVRDSGLATLTDHDLHVQESMARWERTPTFWRPGRTAWTGVDDPIPCRTSAGDPIRGLKLKGVGELRADGADPRAEPPRIDSFIRPFPHVGIRDDGSFCIIESEPAPRGGMVLDRALVEHETAAALCESGVPSIVALRVYRYTEPDLAYQADGVAAPLGVVLAGAPGRFPFRADSLFRSAQGEIPRDELEYVAAITNGEPVLGVIAEVARSYGRVLRGFAGAGFFRHSGSLDNWAYAPEIGSIYLCDLDSVRRLDDRPMARRGLEVVRDVASGVFNLAAAFLDPRTAPIWSGAEIEATDPFGHLLRGYYAGAQERAVRTASQRILGTFLPLHQRSRALAARPHQRIWMDRAAFYCALITLIEPLHRDDEIASEHPVPGPGPSLDQRIVDFLGPTRASRVRAATRTMEDR